MKFSFCSLPLALSLLSFAQAGILEDCGYEIETDESTYSVYSHHYGESSQTLTKIEFDLEESAAAIQIAQNDKEPYHDDKLGLPEIFAALCEKESVKPDDIKWLVFDVYKDRYTNSLISMIRKNHRANLEKTVRISRGSDEWRAIVNTKYYRQAMDLINRPLEKILIGHYTQYDILGNEIPTDCIYFSLPNQA